MTSLEILCVTGPSGRRASPYHLFGDTLIKFVQPPHIWRARQAVGVDESLYHQLRDKIKTIRFQFWDDRVYEISRQEFEAKSFLHGDDSTFIRTRFIRIADLTLQSQQLALFEGGDL